VNGASIVTLTGTVELVELVEGLGLTGTVVFVAGFGLLVVLLVGVVLLFEGLTGVVLLFGGFV
jgi:hypothetical protein